MFDVPVFAAKFLPETVRAFLQNPSGRESASEIIFVVTYAAAGENIGEDSTILCSSRILPSLSSIFSTE